ncbi:MAG: DUF1194 domain-containing protein [Pseudomonadota bacterium]
MIRASLFAVCLSLWAGTAAACRLALVLAMDVSSSVSDAEDALQRGGLASALLAPKVQQAFFATGDPVALAVFEWSGRYNQLLVQDWVLIDSPATLQRVADRIASTPRSTTDYPTALGHALGYASILLTRAPICEAQTVDVSGDGQNNDGFAPADAFGAFPFEAVTVNGLAINVPEDIAAREGQDDLVTYYTREVIRGPGAFVEVANGFEDFAATMERKLIRELGVRIIGQVISER